MTPEIRAPERRAVSRRPRRRPLGRVSVALGLTVFITLVGTTFATATWTAPGSTISGTATSATPLVKFTQTAALTTEYKFPVGSASPSVVRPLVVENAGTTPLDYTLTISGDPPNDLAPAIVLSLWKSAGTTCAATIPSVGTAVGQATANPLNVAPVLPAGTTSAPAGTTFTLCAGTSLTGTGLPGTVAAWQGLSVTRVLTMTGRVGTNWSSVKSLPAFTQNVYRVDTPQSLTCSARAGERNAPGSVTIGWVKPVNGPSQANTVTYRILRGGTEVQRTSSTSAVVTYAQATSTDFSVQTAESVYGTTSVGAPFTVTRSVETRYDLLLLPYYVYHVRCG